MPMFLLGLVILYYLLRRLLAVITCAADAADAPEGLNMRPANKDA